MNYFDVTIGSVNNFEHLQQEFAQYESLVSQLVYWVKGDFNRYAYIKFTNRLTDVIKFIDGQGVKVLHFNDVEDIAKAIREKK